jgi:hypothetical protein
MSVPVSTIRLVGTTRADALEIAEYAGADNVAFEDQPIMERSSGDIALGAAVIIASGLALKGFIAYLAARYRAEDHTTIALEVIRDGETRRLLIRTDSLKAPFDEGLAKQLASFTGIPVGELIGA